MFLQMPTRPFPEAVLAPLPTTPSPTLGGLMALEHMVQALGSGPARPTQEN